MKKLSLWAMGGMLASALLLMAPSAMAASRTLNGQVSDSYCGAHHKIPNAVACTRGCVKHGAKYVLVVGGSHVYSLKYNKKEAAELFKLAGKDASVKGNVKGMTVMVRSVSAGK